MSGEDHVWGVNHARAGDAARVVAAARAVSRLGPVVVAVDGPAGAGKSSLAQLVAADLGDVAAVHMDDLFPGWDGLAAAPALLTAQVLVPLARDEPVTFRRYDWVEGAYADRITVPRRRYVVVEGCASSVGIARPYADVRVWVDADPLTRMRRGLARDGDTFGPHWRRWADQEDALFGTDRTAEHAHVVVRTDEEVA